MLTRPGFHALALIACAALIAPGAAVAAKKPSKPKPDLSITASPQFAGALNPGASVTASAVVRAGKIPVKASKTAFYLSKDTKPDAKDVKLATVATPVIKAGKSKVTTAKITIPATASGPVFLIVCADGAKKIAEASEKNNCKTSAMRKIVEPTPPPTPKAPALPQLAISAVRDAVEGNPGAGNVLEYDISLNAVSASTVTVNWAASSVGTAESNDFVASKGTLSFTPGQTVTTVKVPIVGDLTKETNETVQVRISGATGAKLDAARDNVLATILDDDTTPAKLEITEVNPNVTAGALVELHAITGGTVSGISVETAHYAGSNFTAQLPSMSVRAGEWIVLHYGSPAGVTNELSSTSQCTDAGCFSGAWDVTTSRTLGTTSRVIAVVDALDDSIDGLVVRGSGATAASIDLLDNLDGLQTDGLWVDCADGSCDNGTEYDTVAKDWSSAAADGSTSLRRAATDANAPGDWEVGASSWGS